MSGREEWQDLIRVALQEALAKGGEYADVFVEDRYAESISLDDSRVDRMNSGILRGAGIRLIRNGTVFFAHTELLTERGMREAAAAVASLAHSTPMERSIQFEVHRSNSQSQVRQLPQEVDPRDKIDLLRRADRACRQTDPLISRISAFYGNIRQRIMIGTSEGVLAEDDRCRTRFRFQAVAKRGDKMQTGSATPGALRGFEYLREMDVEELGRCAARQAVLMLDAEQAPVGEMPVILGNGFGGVLFHEACGHGLEADYVQRGASAFAGKDGRQVASPCVTVVDDSALPGEWGSYGVDDEGQAAKRTVLIEEGRLNSFLHDWRSAHRAGVSPTGNGRRESYKHLPYPRMSNTFLLPGTDTLEDMIASTDYGLYAKEMGGGSVNPVTGTFVFSVREAYLIRGGRIVCPVQGVTLTGNGPEVLNKIERVGRDGTLAAASCGKESQSVWVSVGQPSLQIASLTVGGTKLEGGVSFD